jgi:hypothetical protein
MKNGGWLDNYGEEANANDGYSSAPDNWRGDGYSNVGRNYSPAWGGQFQMGGSVYPVNYVPQAAMGASMPGSVGFTYARTQGIPSEGPYAKKTMPSAQGGKKIKIKDERLQGQVVKDNTTTKSIMPDKKKRIIENNLKEIGTNQKKIEDAKAYYKKYLNSPKARERITNMMDDSSASKYAYLYDDEVNPVDQEIKNRLAGLNKLKGKFEYANDFGSNSSSYYDTKKNSIFMRPNSDINIGYYNDPEYTPYRMDLENTIGHEIGHGIQQASNKDSNVWFSNGISKKESDMLMRANIGIINAKNREQILKDKDNPEYKYDLDHDNRPSELKADIDALRYQLYRQGVYDPGTQDFTREHLEKAKPSFIRSRLDEHFTDDELIDLMNKLSYNENNSDGITPIAQNGKNLNPFTYPQPDHYSRINPFIFKDPQHDIFIGGINPTYSTKDFSVGASMVGVGNKDFQKLPADYGIRASYNPTDSLSISANLSKNNIGAGLRYRFEDGGEIAQTGNQTFPNNDRALQILANIQQRKNKPNTPIKIKDEKGQVFKPSESTNVKRKDFDLEQSKANKAYNNAVVAQKAAEQKEAARRAKLTKEQREREDYNAYNEERGSISKYTPESTWQRTKAVVSNPMTAAGYVARGENLPGNFQAGPRNEHDYALDWVNPLQSAVSASQIPGQLSRGEFMDAGLSALDAADLGLFAKGAKRFSTNQLRNLSPAMGFREGGIIRDDRGQWDHPGEITEINSNEITMGPDPKTGKPLTKPLLGISDTGDVKLMRPGGNYKFDGKRVTEYPIAQTGKDIKLKNKKGKVETINTASPEYEKIYKSGDIQSPGAGEGDTPFFGGQLPEVVLQQQMTPLLKAKIDYGKWSNKDAFVDRKKDEYLKSLGSNNWFGADKNNMPESVMRNILGEYDYNRNTKAIEDVAKRKGFDLNTRGNWIYDLTPGEREALINSKYSAQLNPNEFSEMASGVQQLANTLVPGQPWNLNIPGLTQRELEEDRESSLSALKTLAPFNILGNAAANYLKNGSDYVETPLLGTQRMGNVDVWDSMALNPLNLGMITGGSKLVAGVPGAIKNIPGAIKAANQTASKVKNIAKGLPEDINEVKSAIKRIQSRKENLPANINTQLTHVKNAAESFDISDTQGLQRAIDYLADDLRNVYSTNSGDSGQEVFDIANKWKTKTIAKLRNKLNAVATNPNSTPEEYKNVFKEVVDELPGYGDITKFAKSKLTKSQFKQVFSKKEDLQTLKDFAKSIGKKLPEPSKVEYSPQEKETVNAIRELGKFRELFQYDAGRVMRHPEAMQMINNQISKLDTSVVEKLLGVTKQELIDNYKNLVTSSTKADLANSANSPIQFQNIQNATGENAILDPVAEKLSALYPDPYGYSPSNPTLFQKIGKRYLQEFSPYDVEYGNNFQPLIGSAKSSHEFVNEPVMDALGNVLAYTDKFKPAGRTVGQLKSALETAESFPKGTKMVGSGSLSTDSYPLTLDSGMFMMKQGVVEAGYSGKMNSLNDWGYTNQAPELVLKDINSKIEQLEKMSGKKFPRAKYVPNSGKGYSPYRVPEIYFTRLRQGGSINTADENSLVKLDQLTNFTNYNKPQPGGWLSKYE